MFYIVRCIISQIVLINNVLFNYDKANEINYDSINSI